MTPRTLHWFRHDLRLADNPALTKAASEGLVTPIFILDDEAAGDDRLGGATRVWLHHALKSLNVSVENNLIVMSGDAETCLHRIIEQTGATILTFTTSYA
ncbi:MAG TPA: deoxyribodipyrimidine photolyase, partial [Alphaproteobacteria bacterium]|nr:deoxyribodipyrimidine photolyase [Alphaproteobacteria bacterium]